MHRFLVLVGTLVLLGGCSTYEPTYSLGGTGPRLAREQAQDLHARQAAAVPASGLDAPLKPVSTPFPEYPLAFRSADVSGDVTIRFLIEADGRVSNPAVVGAPPAALAAVVLHAIMRWRFEPPMKGGVPTRVHAQQTFSFKLE
jgi:TonB family protein